jgi:hypothetical protein
VNRAHQLLIVFVNANEDGVIDHVDDREEERIVQVRILPIQ